MHGASLSTYQYCPCSREQACPGSPSLSSTHWQRQGSLNLWKTKYYCKAVGGFQLHFQSTKSKSEAYLSRESHIPVTQMHRSSEYPVAGQEIWSTFPYSFTTLNTADVHQAVLRPWFSDVPSGQHPQDTPALHSPRVGEARVPFSRKLPRNDTTLKGADTQVHYSIIQENINTKSFLPGGLCRYQVKRKVCKKGSGDVPRSALSLQQKGWGIQRHT